MPGPLWVAILTCLALTVLTPLLIGVVMFLVPGGRKGTCAPTHRSPNATGLAAIAIRRRAVRPAVR